jgi:hypothetical protein
VAVVRNNNFTPKALFPSPNFGEGIDYTTEFIGAIVGLRQTMVGNERGKWESSTIEEEQSFHCHIYRC